MIKNLVFDIGGVLVDWNPRYYFESYFGGDKEKMEYFLKNVCGANMCKILDFGTPLEEAEALVSGQFPEWSKEIHEYVVHWEEPISGEIAGMRELLQELKSQGYRLFALTNWSDIIFSKVRKKYGIFSLFEDIVVSGAEHLLKPEPEIYHCLLSRDGLKAEECAFIDDRAENVEGAKAVGMKGIVFEGPEKLREALSKGIADRVGNDAR